MLDILEWHTLFHEHYFVTTFAKRSLSHISILPTLTICNFILIKTFDLKFGLPEAPSFCSSSHCISNFLASVQCLEHALLD